MTTFFTSDEHFGHSNVIAYSNRPFSSIEEMNRVLVQNHNSVVKPGDRVIHCGDFTLNKRNYARSIIEQLNGQHVFLTGSHDNWMKGWEPMKNITLGGYVFERKVQDTYVVACHYAMRVWPRSHYNSIMLYGHSHGTLAGLKNQMDVGVDVNNYTPISFEEVLRKLGHNKMITAIKGTQASLFQMACECGTSFSIARKTHDSEEADKFFKSSEQQCWDAGWTKADQGGSHIAVKCPMCSEKAE